MTWQTKAQCDPCWDKENPNREPHRLADLSDGVPNPKEICVTCGNETQSGIYVRKDV